uniref:Uncharacterized protein n=1 Tax=viral metagenome TaxID=1070528 RepID=A0A6C0J4F6_9ZZZZ
MTLVKLARQWINESFNNEIFVIINKSIIKSIEKGSIIVKVTVMANDCIYIETGKVFDMEFKLNFKDNVLITTVYSKFLTLREMREFTINKNISTVRFY